MFQSAQFPEFSEDMVSAMVHEHALYTPVKWYERISWKKAALFTTAGIATAVIAKIVYDADGMDLFGPIGLMRALLSCALRNKEFDCIIKKLEWRISEIDNFYSEFAKIYVKNNCEIIENYLKDLKNQIKLLS